MELVHYSKHANNIYLYSFSILIVNKIVSTIQIIFIVNNNGRHHVAMHAKTFNKMLIVSNNNVPMRIFIHKNFYTYKYLNNIVYLRRNSVILEHVIKQEVALNRPNDIFKHFRSRDCTIRGFTYVF